MLARLRTWWHAVRHRADWERDLEAELLSHVEERAEDLAKDGMTRADALRRARIELGPRQAYKEEARASSGLRWADELLQDARYAFRAMARSPGFSLVAIVSLALGVGANTVVFSAMNALLLRPLPIASPNEVHFLQTSRGPTISYPNYRDLAERNATFTGLAAYRFAPMGLASGERTERIWGYLATGAYFDLLGLKPSLGRLFTAEDDRAPGASPVVVLSYAAWQRRFAADPAVLGKEMSLNGLVYTIIGVAPPGFSGTELLYQAELWVPMAMQPQIEGWSWLDVRNTANCMLIGRLRPGVAPSRAEADLNRIARALASDYPASNAGLSLTLVRPGLIGEMGRQLMSSFVSGIMVLAGLVLLAACANLAGLLAARSSDRAREIAVRIAIGAGRSRVLRQLATETLALALTGGAAGWLLAATMLRALSRWRPPVGIPLQLGVEPDATVFGFALIATLGAGILCAIAPIRQAWRVDLNQAIKGAPTVARRRRQWAVRELVLAAQMALACILLAACAVSIRGLSRALSMPLGIELGGLAVVNYDLAFMHLGESEGRALQRRTLEAAASLPGVTVAAYSSSIPLSLDQSSTYLYSDQAADFRASNGLESSEFQVSPGYFRAVGTPLVAGREFTWRDDHDAPRVAIINETLAVRLFQTREAIGRRVKFGTDSPALEVVGIVRDGKYVAISEDQRPALFEPAAQSYTTATSLLVRTDLPEGPMADEMRRALAALDSRIPVYRAGAATEL
ncbi:MAG: ADOP family duplicated permease, partial [Gemmatimonadota bacterium]